MATKKATVKKVTKKAVKKEAATPVVKTERKSSVKAEVFDMTGKVIESMLLPGNVFGVKVNKKLMAQAIRVYQVNQRSGSANTKTRGEVTGSTRKIYRQKGTGRARHGGVRAPIFVKGGVAHGPKAHDFSLSMPQKMRTKALFSALSAKTKDNELKVLSGLDGIEPKTKHFAAFLKGAALTNKKSILLVLPEKKENVTKAVRNIDGLTYLYATQLNTYEVLRNQLVLVTKDALGTLESHFAKEKANV